ncbi:tryptophan--tRNA ligase [Patescibacteria group bacterium]|nr:tryptophan--tRNA ligase [Patescibacteria group bacterium]MCL5410127.1 tryptophan--tRNA ligase [Patescibacteria group bacterium]
MKKRVFSGVQPSGDLHIGNYLGAIKRWVALQEEYDNIFCVVDLHAITTPQDPKILKQKIREVAALYLASGIDPQKSKVFVQSHVLAHTELAWILNCFLPVGWMMRMTQFKEKSAKQRQQVSTGLLDYPALMAADILLYQTDLVPVGEDQKQHVELTRDVAQRFNSLYGETFKLPAALIAKEGARIMGLDDPTKKMSKSETATGHAIYLLDSPDEIKTKIAHATTDSGQEIKFDLQKPGIYNLLEIYQLFTGVDRHEIESAFAGKGYGELKSAVAEAIIEGLRPLQQKYTELMADPAYLESLLAQGADQVRPLAEKTVQEVKNKIGLG